jgi:hypothetical protein
MFAKIFTQIFDSSIVESPETRFTFMDMLVLCDAAGVVDMTHEAIARRTNRPIEVIRKTIAELESPDSRSRTPEHDGKRIVRLDEHRDWGWMIVNYDRFRNTASDEQRREKTTARVRKFRSKPQQNPPCNAHVTLCNAVKRMKRQGEAEAEVEAEAEEGGRKISPSWEEKAAKLENWQLLKDLKAAKMVAQSLKAFPVRENERCGELAALQAEAKRRGLDSGAGVGQIVSHKGGPL